MNDFYSGRQFPSWTNGGHVCWSMGPGLYSADMDVQFQPDYQAPEIPATAVNLGVTAPADKLTAAGLNRKLLLPAASCL